MSGVARQRLQDERGAVLVAGLLLAVALLIVIGAAVDIGRAFIERRELVSLADEGALSGSQALDLDALHAGRLALDPSRAGAPSEGEREPRIRDRRGRAQVSDDAPSPGRALDPDREGACDRGAPGAMRPSAAIGAAIGGGVLFGAAGIHLEAAGTELGRVSILGATLGALAYSDVTEHRIPNRIVVPASAACAALLVAEGVRLQHLLGSLALVVLMLGLGLVWPASFGMGDVKLALLLVLGLGEVAAQALVLGLVLAGAFGAALILRHGRSATMRSLPLAPFLSSGAAVVVLL
jgi:leader peptidase (prepilin peptidase) / N-methyltransferase